MKKGKKLILEKLLHDLRSKHNVIKNNEIEDKRWEKNQFRRDNFMCYAISITK
jgi:hypothetical protein